MAIQTYFFSECGETITVPAQWLQDILDLWFTHEITTIQAVDAWVKFIINKGAGPEAVQKVANLAIQCMAYPTGAA